MERCFIGRGQLLASPFGAASSPFLALTGESEVTVTFSEDIGTVVDKRYGREEVVDSFVKGVTGGLKATTLRLNADTMAFLHKRGTSDVVSGAVGGEFTPIVGRFYYFGSNLSAVTVVDDLVAPVGAAKYSLDLDTGVLEVLSVAGTTGDWTIAATSTSVTRSGFAVVSDVVVRLLVTGTDVISGNKFVAEFYKATLVLPGETTLVSREFKPYEITANLIADMSKEDDAVLGRFGVLNFL